MKKFICIFLALVLLLAAGIGVAAYADNEQDNFAELTVTKSFDGLTAEDMEALKDDFKIEIVGSDGSPAGTLTLSDDDVSVDGDTYTWVVELEADEYTLTEYNYGAPGYRCATTVAVDDDAAVTGNSAVADLDAPEYSELGFSNMLRYPSCASTEIEGIDSVFICMRFTGSSTIGNYRYLLWTEERLTEEVYRLLIQYINQYGGGPFNSITVAETYYISGDDRGFSYPNQTYDEDEHAYYTDADNYLTIKAHSTWNQLLYGDLAPFLELFTAKVSFTNTYTEAKAADLTISKTVKGGAANPDEHFTFTLSSAGLNDTFPVSYTGTDDCSETHPTNITFVDGEASMTLKHVETTTIEGLPVGAVVTVTETNGGSYDTTVNGVEQYSATVTIAEEGNSLAFENTAEPPSVTGIIMDTIPYIILVVLVAACVGAGVFITVRRRRKKRDTDVWNE